LCGKRELNVRQIRVLAKKFHVSPAVFIIKSLKCVTQQAQLWYTLNGVNFNFYFWLNSGISGFEVSNRCEACND